MGEDERDECELEPADKHPHVGADPVADADPVVDADPVANADPVVDVDASAAELDVASSDLEPQSPQSSRASCVTAASGEGRRTPPPLPHEAQRKRAAPTAGGRGSVAASAAAAAVNVVGSHGGAEPDLLALSGTYKVGAGALVPSPSLVPPHDSSPRAPSRAAERPLMLALIVLLVGVNGYFLTTRNDAARAVVSPPPSTEDRPASTVLPSPKPRVPPPPPGPRAVPAAEVALETALEPGVVVAGDGVGPQDEDDAIEITEAAPTPKPNPKRAAKPRPRPKVRPSTLLKPPVPNVESAGAVSPTDAAPPVVEGSPK